MKIFRNQRESMKPMEDLEKSIELEKEIIKKADQLTPFKIKLKKIIDPKILGGFVLRVGDLQYNASLSNRLNILKRELVKS